MLRYSKKDKNEYTHKHDVERSMSKMDNSKTPKGGPKQGGTGE